MPLLEDKELQVSDISTPGGMIPNKNSAGRCSSRWPCCWPH